MLKKFLARFPSDLPRDGQSLTRYIDEILSLYGLPKTLPYKRALAKAIHGASQGNHRIPKYAFYAHMHRFEAMMAAVKTITDIEAQEKAAKEAQNYVPGE